MQDLKIAKRYAKGLMLFAQEAGQEELVYEEMNDLYQIVHDSKDLRTFLITPAIDTSKKHTIVKQIFKDFSLTSQKFIELMITHKRTNLVMACAETYRNLYEINKRIKEVNITTATEVSDEFIEKILSKITKLTQDQQLKVNRFVDKSIIGGFIVKVGDQQMDNSIKQKLKKLNQKFSNNHYIPKW